MYHSLLTESGPGPDTIPPVIRNCPSDKTETTSTGVAQVTWTEPSATDNSGIEPIVSRSHAPGSSFFVGTTTVVTYTFSDLSGNTARCTFNVIVSGEHIE